jgi:hypothetical protein
MLKFLFLICISFLSDLAFAGKIQYNEGEALNISYQFTPPMENNFELKDDKQKSLANLRIKVHEWQKQDEFVKNWNIESSNMYATSDSGQKNILLKSLTRFSERRGKEFIQSKNKKSSANNTDLTFEKNLNSPNKKYFWTYQTVVLKGKIKLNFNNPYLEVYSQYSLSRKDELVISKRFEDFRFKTSLIYSPSRDSSTLSIEKNITDNIVTKFSNMNLAENRIEIFYTSVLF